jgi:glyoxylase-like metal-dependent hydrolase (beta-lactamase superfamily II)
MQVAPGIHRIQTPFADRFVCLYLLVGTEAALLLDTGLDNTPGEYLAPYLDKIGLAPSRVRYIVSSHADFDHTAGNASAKELFPNALLACHELDRRMVEDIDIMIDERYDEFAAEHAISDGDEAKDFIRSCARHVPVDIALRGGETFHLGADWHVQIWHTAGHTHGHLTLCDPRENHLIIADATLYNAVLKADGQPAFPPTYRYVDAYSASLQRIEAARPNLLLTSHYPLYQGTAAAEFLAASRAFVERTDAELCKALVQQQTLRELCDSLGPQLGSWPSAANAYLSFPLMGHLERMIQHGQVGTGKRDGLTTFSLRN